MTQIRITFQTAVIQSLIKRCGSDLKFFYSKASLISRYWQCFYLLEIIPKERDNFKTNLSLLSFLEQTIKVKSLRCTMYISLLNLRGAFYLELSKNRFLFALIYSYTIREYNPEVWKALISEFPGRSGAAPGGRSNLPKTLKRVFSKPPFLSR